MEPRACHESLRVQKAQIVAGEPIPAEDDVELLAEVQQCHVDYLAERLCVPKCQVDHHRRRHGAGGVGCREGDGCLALG